VVGVAEVRFENKVIRVSVIAPNEFRITPVVAQGLPSATVVSWGNVQNKPLVFPPEAHTQPASSIPDLETAIEAETDPGNLVLWFENQLL
jgi:hypothetical protein